MELDRVFCRYILESLAASASSIEFCSDTEVMPTEPEAVIMSPFASWTVTALKRSRIATAALRALEGRSSTNSSPPRRATSASPLPGSGVSARSATSCAIAIGHQLGALALDRARIWATGSDTFPSRIAIMFLADHGTLDNHDALLAALHAAIDAHDWYQVETCGKGLGRLNSSLAVPPLVHAWEVTTHSHGPHDLLTALQAITPETAEPLATEGLHDCESSVRAHSAAASPAATETRRQLRRLRDDPLEDEGVRTAARRRLESEYE